jgi:predicted acylesterase/phospholipase RssA
MPSNVCTRNAALALAMLLASIACSSPISTRTLIGVFNDGVIDTSNGDPFRDDAERRAELVARVVKQELVDGYFAQGAGAAAHGHSVAAWMRSAAGDPEAFYAMVKRWACDRGVRTGDPRQNCVPPAVSPGDPEARLAPSRALTRSAADHWAGGHAAAPVCTASGRDDHALARFADAVRFEAALDRAVPVVGELLVERLVDLDAVENGVRRAFTEAADYLENRHWHREPDTLTTGLVVKGGASTGVYSAGVVWVALRLIDRCRRDPDCDRDVDLRLSLISGTSTGALIAAAVDMFNSGEPDRDHAIDLNNLAYWFTCKSTPDLYCLQERSAFRLIDDQRGLVRFDGIEDLMAHNVGCEELQNRSELIANSVDFRSGALYAFSDQDPSEMRSPRDVVDGVLASALLPFVGNPVDHLPWATAGAPRPTDPRRRSAFLDGGVRSELPVLPLARRGAERVLVVSSAASVLGETGPLHDALDTLIRYIDVSTGGVTESELAHSQRWVESARLREVDLCEERALGGACGPGCDVKSLCEAHYARVCQPDAASAAPAAPSPALAGGASGVAERETDRLHRYWRMTSFFRDELAVTPSKGYDFDRAAHRSLFHAGAEAARVRCLEIARTLGVIPREGALDPVLRRKVVDWCSVPLPPERVVCRDEAAAAKRVPACVDPAHGPRTIVPSSATACDGAEP